jgi:predicted amidophosphoribosyltransferase
MVERAIEVPGFGACRRCPYRRGGSAALCWACAQGCLTRGEGPHCGVCDRPLDRVRGCTNYWCQRDDRGFDAVWAIALYNSPLRDVIVEYKYRGKRAWATILGRLVSGYLTEHSPWFEDVDLVVACPGQATPDRPWDHMGLVVDAAAASRGGELWPFDTASPRAVVKTAPTVPLMSVGSAPSRRLWAACDLRPALAVPQPDRVRGRQVLVVDDVFTDGSTLREVALTLRGAGAVGVCGLVLARQALRLGPRPPHTADRRQLPSPGQPA